MAKRPQSSDINIAFDRIFTHSSARPDQVISYRGKGASPPAEPPARHRGRQRGPEKQQAGRSKQAAASEQQVASEEPAGLG